VQPEIKRNPFQKKGFPHYRAGNFGIAGVVVPDWPELLAAATKLSGVLELAYLGVDFVLDAQRGPVVLEANARPGLAIQIANRAGLLPRLHRVDAMRKASG
jgi:D-alanine-D-alanine ligase-like ATP-grasp enzyme